MRGIILRTPRGMFVSLARAICARLSPGHNASDNNKMHQARRYENNRQELITRLLIDVTISEARVASARQKHFPRTTPRPRISPTNFPPTFARGGRS